MAKKEFNVKAFGIIMIIVVAAVLAVLTVTTYVTKYIGFNPEKVATAYVDTIVQSGDGYNAYKNSILSKDDKFGNYIRENYLYPVIYDGYKPGDDTKGLTGLNSESHKGKNTLEDDGTLEGELIEKMYPVLVLLIEENNGFDNLDKIMTSYVSALQLTRIAIFKDDFFDDEVFFTVFEANLSDYGKSLTGAEKIVDENTGVVKQEEKTGKYQEKYGDDYKIETVVTAVRDVDVPEGIDASAAKTVTISVKVNGETVAEGIEITVVKIKSTWYVANEMCDTSVLYNFYK